MILWDDHGVPVTKEEALLVPVVLSRKGDVCRDSGFIFYTEALTFIGAAEGAVVVRAANGDLQKDAAGFARRPDDVPFVVHGYSPVL